MLCKHNIIILAIMPFRVLLALGMHCYMSISKSLRRRSKTDKLQKKMGVFDIVIPCFQGSFVCEISPRTVAKIQSEPELSQGIKTWFQENSGEVFDDDMFFQCIESDTGEQVDELMKDMMKTHLVVRNETVALRRISMLTLMKGKHYPSELSSFVQNMYTKGSDSDKEMVGTDESEDALSFHQWVVCHSMVDPKVFSLDKVTKLLQGGAVHKNWFDYRDFQRLQSIRKELLEQQKAGSLSKPLEQWTSDDVRSYPAFSDELWNAYDPCDPERQVDVWWVEDFVSDVDLVHISGAAFNGPNADERIDVTPFSQE